MVKRDKLVRVVLFVIALLAIADTILIANRSGGMDFGILIPGAGGCCLLLGLFFTKTGIYKKKKKLFNRIGKVIISLFILWLATFIVVTTVLIAHAISQEGERVDSVIVLGAGLNGETPTLVLVERLNNALEYHRMNPEAKIIVSGGQGYGETITEAEAMKRYLVNRGVPEASIMKEEKSTSTYENMVLSKRVYEDALGEELDKVMIITNDFHMFRAKLLAKRAGLEPYGMSSPTPWYIYPNVFLREYLAVFKSLIFDRG